MKKELLIGLLLLISAVGNSQEVDSVKKMNTVKWTNSAQMGMLFNANQGMVGRISTRFTSGIAFGKFYGSLGIGFDDYTHYLVVPIYLELNYSLFELNSTPLFFLQWGTGLPIEKQLLNYESTGGGLLVGTGIGYKLVFGRMGLVFKSGYQLQVVNAEKLTVYYSDVFSASSNIASGYSPKTELTHKMGRAMVSIGIVF